MAHVEWSTGIDSVSGALSRPSKTGPHSCNKMLLGTHRVAPTTSDCCTRVYMRKKIKRNTPLTNDEVEARARFSAVTRAVAVRAKDLTKVTADQQAFLAQKDLSNGKKTMRAYLWKVCGLEYDQAHNG